MNTKRLLRLFAVVAIIGAVLVPSVAGAVPFDPNQATCEGIVYNPSFPAANHRLYGSATPTNADGYMVVDLSGATQGMVVIWDGYFAGTSAGALITGSGFNDIICGTSGDDIIKGRAGDDRIWGGGSWGIYDPVMKHPAAGFTFVGPVFGDALYGQGGNDFLNNATGGPAVAGTQVPPVLWPSPGTPNGASAVRAALMKGGQGNDELDTGSVAANPDYAYGNKGDDTLVGVATTDYLFGQQGDDFILGFGGAGSFASGGKGADTLYPRGGPSYFQGGTGDDTFLMGRGVAGNVGDGGLGNDTFTLANNPGATLAYWAYGGAGDDSVTGGPAADFLFGDYALVATVGYPAVGWPEPINVTATGADVIKGSTGLDTMFGGPGNDDLFGNKTDLGPFDVSDISIDVLNGGPGSDRLFGGSACTDGGAGVGDTANDTGAAFPPDFDSGYYIETVGPPVPVGLEVNNNGC